MLATPIGLADTSTTATIHSTLPPHAVQAEPGNKIALGRVLALKHNGTFHVGTPYLENVKVEAEVLDELKGPKASVCESTWEGEGGVCFCGLMRNGMGGDGCSALEACCRIIESVHALKLLLLLRCAGDCVQDEAQEALPSH